MTNYFKYQLKNYQTHRWITGHSGRVTGAVITWRWFIGYIILPGMLLLELGDLIHKQTFDYTNAFLNTGFGIAGKAVFIVSTWHRG